MYELIQVSPHDYYIESPAKIGICLLSDRDVCLIDSGSDKDAGRKAMKIITENGWHLTAIYNTHSHADHIGGNKYLYEQTGCAIYAPGIECAITSHPILEPALLYGGYPSRELRHKFLLAQESPAQPLCEAVLPSGFSIIPLPGHFFDMVGFRTPDDTVYLADCLSSKETLDKYGIGFLYDVGAYLQTLEAIKSMRARLFIPSHAAPAEDMAELAQYNIDKVNEVAGRILTLCAQPITFEVLLARLFDAYSLQMSMQQHALVGSTVRSYLSYLKESGRIDAFFENNLLLWQAT